MPEKAEEILTELEWMVQNSQVSDLMLTEAFTREYYSMLYQLAWLVSENHSISHHTAQGAIRLGVKNRHRYVGDCRLKSWLLGIAYSHLQSRSWLFSMKRSLQWWQPVRVLLAETYREPGEIQARVSHQLTILRKLKGINRLIIYFHYVCGLEIAETGQITGKKINEVFSRLDKVRHTLQLEEQGVGVSPDCKDVRRRLREVGSGMAFASDLKEYDEHRAGCESCRLYGERLPEVEQEIKLAVQAAWPEVHPPEGLFEASTIQGEITPSKRRLVLSTKELLLVTIAAMLVGIMGWYGSLFRVDKPVATPSEVISQEIVVVKITSTPLSKAADPNVSQLVRMDPPNRLSGGSEVLLQITEENKLRIDQDAESGYAQSGPSALAAVLKYWGWEGTAGDVTAELQPNPMDVTVMPYELVNFSQDSGFSGAYYLGGDYVILKRILAAGFPVIVQRGFVDEEDGSWFGGYQVLNGYKSSDRLLYGIMFDGGEEEIHFEKFDKDWQAFSYAYLILYPPQEEASLNKILLTDRVKSSSEAASRASMEIYSNSTRERVFAWFNRGTSLAYLEDYYGAALAYDEAFSMLRTHVSIKNLWRLMWYQTRPYWAYYYSGRYQDLIELSTYILDGQTEPVLEESYYWRGLAKAALGDHKGAVEDIEEAVRVNPNFSAGREQLKNLLAGR